MRIRHVVGHSPWQTHETNLPTHPTSQNAVAGPTVLAKKVLPPMGAGLGVWKGGGGFRVPTRRPPMMQTFRTGMPCSPSPTWVGLGVQRGSNSRVPGSPFPSQIAPGSQSQRPAPGGNSASYLGDVVSHTLDLRQVSCECPRPHLHCHPFCGQGRDRGSRRAAPLG